MPEKEEKRRKKYSSVQDYQVLEDIEHIRKRPGNYIGSTDEQGWHHLFQEVIDNSIDEAVAGHCDQIKVILSPDQRTITVEDNGYGVPIETHPKTNQSVLVTLFSALKSGGKFDDKIYKTSGGLHGIGVTAVNALSQELKVWNKRQGKTEILEFSRGLLKSEEIIDSFQATDGVIVTFTPDPEIFKDFTYFKIDTIQNRLKELAYLNPNLTLIFQSSPTAEAIIYHFSSGLAGWVKEINQDDYLANTEICSEEWSNPPHKEYFYLNFAWQYNQKQRKSQVRSFCNNIGTAGGGTHVEGFENGLVSATRDWIKDKYSQLKVNVIRDDVGEGLVAVLAIRMKEPQFAGQTKSSLTDKHVREIVKNATYELVKKFLQDHGNSAEAISQQIITNAQNRVKSEEYKETLREGGRGANLPGKLAPCISKEVMNNELFIVEGDSAGGSAKAARFPFNQAVLPVQGKFINTIKARWSQISKNKEVINIMSALGFSTTEAAQNYYNRFQNELDTDFSQNELEIPEEFIYQDDAGQEQIIPAHTALTREQVKTIVEKTKEKLIKKLRYGKIIIMTDADPDGKHIGCLELAFFIRYFRYLIEGCHLFLAVTPLYSWRTKEGVRYFNNDYDWEIYRRENKKVAGSLQRFKGLGEMNAKQLREVAMVAEKRCVNELTYSDPLAIWKTVQDLMGPKSEPRKRLLESGEYKNAQSKVTDGKADIRETLLVDFSAYGYEVVEDRALTQLQDGLKPVQRYILYVLYLLNCLPNRPHRKSSKVVGDVIGGYHPHGDQSIYQAMVKMAQDFNYRYPLIDGQGNWGSIDGDSAAAFRYTEARLTRFGLYFLKDLEFETVVNWKDNHDGTEKEPEMLPPHLNLLLNGSSGIAVGMSANIPPHNLGEVVDMTTELVNNPQLTIEELIITWECSNCQNKGRGGTTQCSVCQSTEIKSNYFGPDFPTGGQILERGKLLEIYEKGECPKGKGTIYIRAKAEIISSKKEKEKKDLIRITELPFKINKSKLVVNISQIIKDKRIAGLKSVADYSNFEDPVNIHCYFDPNYDGEVILNQLYKKTKLQSTFSFQMRSLIGDQPQVFSLKEIIQGFIVRKSENIRKKAQFIYCKTQKELVNLKTRHFIIKNYQGIAQIIHNSSSEEESQKQLINKFQEEIKELKSLTIDLFLIDLIIKAQKTLGELQSKSYQKNEAVRKEKYRELVGLVRQIDVYRDEKNYHNKESEIKEIKEKKTSLNMEENVLSEMPELLEDYLNPEQKVVNRILDTPATFRQFTPEKQEKLQSDIETLKGKILQQQLLIFNQEQRKQQLIHELVELKKDYADDHRRTVITSQSYSIAERQLIPHEERIVLLSRSENKKENKFNNYLTSYNLASLDPTNIPSQGKELKTRGDNWTIVKLNRRDDLWCFSNYGKLYILNFYLFAANKIANLDEECFTRKGKSTIQNQEYFTSVLPMREEPTEKFLLIITKKGKIKCLERERFQKASKSGKNVVKLGRKMTEECSLHQAQLSEHKADSHVCGISCLQRRELQKQIKACNDCQKKWVSSDDEISKVILIHGKELNPNEEVEIILKRKSKGGKIKNIKFSAYRQTRKKIELVIDDKKEKINEYCQTHQAQSISHLTNHKKTNTYCSITCSMSKGSQKQIKACNDCQSPKLFTKQLRKQIKCERVMDVLVSQSEEERKNSILLLIKKDNTCEKRPLVTVKNWISADTARLKRTDYCKKHWGEWEKVEQEKQDKEQTLKEEKQKIEEKVLKSTLPLKNKKEVLKEVKLIKGAKISKELERKIATSPIDPTIGEIALQEQIKDLIKSGENYQQLLQEYQEKENEFNKFKEKTEQCKDCQKYCSKHKEEIEKHKTCSYCHKNDKQIQQAKEQIKEIKDKLEELKKTNPEAKKEIKKLTNDLSKKEAEKKKLHYEAFTNRVKCLTINTIKKERKYCSDCQEKINKKHLIKTENPLQHICIADKEANKSEIYLLSKKDVCWYNKKDLIDFLKNDENHSKSLLRNKTREITDVKVHSF
ncbi:DNA gyrase subunit A [endosymbiont GvMRE of Glomus versiforme]|uniref:DNA gyrase subunit A n=1 Tax=endosymbiont GvMRE of Glomus versiforme TaxID=2039283 RepID=UPI000EC180BC|nr:DNA gyrase subunit A [endosymbiont GvMRE of Glomus versiforme]RHZ35471.1 DNA gyrase subunit B [endosymbiont GvMRE of Glomus versiforme]